MVYTSNVSKEGRISHQEKRGEGKGMVSQQTTERKEEKREEGLEEQLVLLKFYPADHNRVAQ